MAFCRKEPHAPISNMAQEVNDEEGKEVFQTNQSSSSLSNCAF